MKFYQLLSIPALVAVVLSTGCQRNTVAAAGSCIDPTKIKPDAMCTMEYNPVCGCDKKTYSNPCVATNAGVTRYTKGECATTSQR